MDRSLWAVLVGTFTLRFSTGLTGALLVFYLADLPSHGGEEVSSLVVGLMAAAFFAAELLLAPPFGLLSDRVGHHRVMQLGPLFGMVAVVITFATTDIGLLLGTRLLEGASTAASIPSILGFIAMATAADELLRGRASARFEGATIAGLGAGFVAAGPMYVAIGTWGFLVNAAIYAVSLAIYRYGVREPPEAEAQRRAPHPGFGRYLEIIRSSHLWLLAPTWIAINAAIGLYTTQTIFQLVRTPDPAFADQLLMGGFSPIQVSVGLAVGLGVFFFGLAFWGERFRTMRRTTIIGYGIGGGFVMVAAAICVNHSQSLPLPIVIGLLLVLAAGLFVLAGATPAALGLLADVTEAFPADRGAIMGLYSVFLAIGQIAGSLVGGLAAEARGIDGIFIATFVLLLIALLPLRALRRHEHIAAGGAEGVVVLE
jgi:MFS family permease